MKHTPGLNTTLTGTSGLDLFEHADKHRVEDKTEEEIAEDAATKGWEAFWQWKEKRGANHVLKRCYAITAKYAARRSWRRYKMPISAKLIWELVRQELKEGRIKAKGMRIDLTKWRGWTLPNDMTPYIARHIMDHKPEWEGIFELRKIGGESA